MKQFVVSRDFKKYLVLGMLFFQAHAFGSDRTPPGDVSKLVNINRIKIDALSKQVATQIDAVVALITADFNNTMTAIADIHCSGGSTGTASCDSAGTFTAIAALQADLDACCITLGNKIDAIVTSSGSCNLSGTYTAIAGLQSDLDVCCLILNSKVDALSTLVIKDFNGTYTAIA
ncbi:MAG: hypothetical protein P4L31_06705 [Candidatus Babeliales bacterium]|nr:hypothetical protein [Candidatus Babeliales bacterium]